MMTIGVSSRLPAGCVRRVGRPGGEGARVGGPGSGAARPRSGAAGGLDRSGPHPLRLGRPAAPPNPTTRALPQPPGWPPPAKRFSRPLTGTNASRAAVHPTATPATGLAQLSGQNAAMTDLASGSDSADAPLSAAMLFPFPADPNRVAAALRGHLREALLDQNPIEPGQPVRPGPRQPHRRRSYRRHRRRRPHLVRLPRHRHHPAAATSRPGTAPAHRLQHDGGLTPAVSGPRRRPRPQPQRSGPARTPHDHSPWPTPGSPPGPSGHHRMTAWPPRSSSPIDELATTPSAPRRCTGPSHHATDPRSPSTSRSHTTCHPARTKSSPPHHPPAAPQTGRPRA